jgi:endonuclease G
MQNRLWTIALTILVVYNTACKKSDTTDAPVNGGNQQDTATVTPPSPPPVPDPPITDNDHMLMGNPSKAAAIADSINNYLMRKTFFATSYSNKRGEPNWVSWHLFTPDLGSASRQDDFRADASLPATFYAVQANAYTGSGFDRGHHCPSADRTTTTTANSATFLMTNMIPQAPNNNQQTWGNMENYVRSLLTGGKEVYIIMGSYGAGGSGSNGFATSVNGGLVTVPAYVWKVVVVLDNGNGDISRVNSSTRVIAVITPNTNGVSSDWKQYRTSVDAIEAATGYDLLTALPVSLQDTLEARVDNL